MEFRTERFKQYVKSKIAEKIDKTLIGVVFNLILREARATELNEVRERLELFKMCYHFM